METTQATEPLASPAPEHSRREELRALIAAAEQQPKPADPQREEPQAQPAPPRDHAATRAPQPTPEPAPQEPVGPLGLVDQLLRNRGALIARIDSGEDLIQIARVMLVTIAVSAMVFGAAIGFYRGGVQVLFAAVKLPLVILFTAALCAPAYSALKVVIAGKTKLVADFALTLSSLALGSLFVAAMAPILLLAIMLDFSYHTLILLVVGCCSIGGAVGLSLFARGVRGERWHRRLSIAAGLLVVVALVGTQMTWTFRPYLVRPRTDEVPFVRQIEGSFVDAVGRSLKSSLGIYSRESAPLPGEPRYRVEEASAPPVELLVEPELHRESPVSTDSPTSTDSPISDDSPAATDSPVSADSPASAIPQRLTNPPQSGVDSPPPPESSIDDLSGWRRSR